jgi:hypothetical protein
MRAPRINRGRGYALPLRRGVTTPTLAGLGTRCRAGLREGSASLLSEALKGGEAIWLWHLPDLKSSKSELFFQLLGGGRIRRVNVVVSGGTGSGKTTLLGVLASFIPDHERLVTIEDAAELRLGKPHVVALEARPANVEGRGEVTVRDLVRNALRMRPDRIIVGEVRGGEALDMLQAMNTGHEGSLSTAHAKSRLVPPFRGRGDELVEESGRRKRTYDGTTDRRPGRERPSATGHDRG